MFGSSWLFDEELVKAALCGPSLLFGDTGRALFAERKVEGDLLLPEAGAIYVMDRGYVDFGATIRCTGSARSSLREPSQTWMRRVCSAPVDRESGTICDQSIALNGFYAGQNYPEKLWLFEIQAAADLKTPFDTNEPARCTEVQRNRFWFFRSRYCEARATRVDSIEILSAAGVALTPR